MTPTMRGRRRPRYRSVSFHGLWWVMRREAALQILWGSWTATTNGTMRKLVRDAGSRHLTECVAAHLRKYPDRRFTT